MDGKMRLSRLKPISPPATPVIGAGMRAQRSNTVDDGI